jgi:hypothetical protein
MLMNDCWEWLGRLSPQGYAVRSNHGNDELMHRIVYEAMYGPIPDASHVHHICENPACINPNHLRALSVREHLRIHAKRPEQCTRCGSGDWRYRPNGARYCGECNRRHAYEYKHRVPA